MLAIPSGASAKTHPLVQAEFKKQPKLKRYTLAESQCRSARKALVFYKLRHQTWLELRDIKHQPNLLEFPRGCAHTNWVVKRWRARAHNARVAYFKWLDSEYVLKDFEVTEGSHAWFKAIDEAQKVYPGTEAWLKSCSASEGGWGRWVPNSQGSGVGGWMQMYPSTWSTMFYGWSGNEGALDYATRKGFTVPESARSWYSPLGQALASAHGYMNGRRGEWYGGGCSLN